VDGIVKIIHEGKGKMKGLGDKLNHDQAKAIAEYVLTLAK
jgi:mono/diheme cytochrome c family protein